MSKKRVPREQRHKDETWRSEVEALLHVPDGSRIEIPKPGKSPNQVSNPLEGFTVEVNLVAMFKRLAKLRKKMRSPSDSLEQEFVALWRRGLRLRARLRRVRKRPTDVWTSEEVWEIILYAIEAGVVRERLVWKFGGLGAEMAKRIESRLRSNEGLAEANKKREAGLTEGLKHKLNLMCEWKPKISRRDVARHLLEESEEDSLSCHDCQRAKWVNGGGDLLPDARCENYRRYGKCRKCDDCTMSYMRVAEWRNVTREKNKKKRLAEERTNERMCETLAKRIGNIDPRPSRRRNTRKVRRGVPRG